MRECCIIDQNNYYAEFVLVQTIPATDDQPEEQRIMGYTLKDGETLLDAPCPHRKAQAGGTGLVKPLWTGTEWTEGATAEELSAFDAANPAPVFQPPPPSASDLILLMTRGAN